MLESRAVWRYRGGRSTGPVADWVVVEEPLEIRIGGQSLAVIMRTPGQDLELAAGFCLTEGVVRRFDDLAALRQCRSGAEGELNVVEVTLAEGIAFDGERLRRNLMASAACGLCGRASLEALATQATPVTSTARVRRDVLIALPDRLRSAQDSFGRSGALHAAGLFDTGGTLLVAREDVGRHNAVDKVIGRASMDGRSSREGILLVSGRTSFEILQKAAVAGIPIVCAISGPTTLAIETARAFNITLVNFLRGADMNVSSVPERIEGP